MNNKRTLSRGHVQYMSAGTGVFHSEHNRRNETLRFMQIWILPDQKGYKPDYGDYLFDWDDRKEKWLHIVSPKGGKAPIQINQDSNLYVLELEQGKGIDFHVGQGRQAYLVQIEGSSEINGITLKMRDAMEITEEDITIQALETSHLLVVEMKK